MPGLCGQPRKADYWQVAARDQPAFATDVAEQACVDSLNYTRVAIFAIVQRIEVELAFAPRPQPACRASE
jgi:hypothetical protein